MLEPIFAGLFRDHIEERDLPERKILEALPDIVYVYDLNEERLVYSNHRFKELLGYTLAEIEALGTPILEKIVHAADIAPLQTSLRQLTYASDDQIIDSEYRLLDHSGDWRWMFSRVRVFSRDAEGQTRQILCVVQDITSQKALEDALEENLSIYLTLFEKNNDAIFAIDLDGNMMASNPRGTAMLGYELDDLIGQSWSQLFPPEAHTHFQDVMRQLRAGEVVPVYEQTLLQRDGRKLPVEINVSLVSAPSGDYLHYQVIARDISGRKRREAEIAAERNLLRTLIDHSPDYIFVKDREGRFVISNPAHTRASHVESEDQLFGKTAFDFFPNELAAQYHTDDVNVMISDEPLLSVERETVDDVGSKKWVLTTKVPLHNERGEVVGLTGMSRDITERKEREIALQESEARYRSLVTALSEGIVFRDSEGIIRACNASAERILEIQASEIIGQRSLIPLREAIYPDGSPFPLEAHPGLVALRTGQPQRDIVMGLAGTKGITWISINTQPLFRDGETKPYAAVTSISDITERKQAEEALAEERGLLRTLIDHLPGPVYLKDTECRFIVANQRSADLMGAANAPELIGKTDFDYYPPEMAAEFFAGEQAAMKRGQVLMNNEERVLDHKLGEVVWMLTSVIPWFDQRGKVKGMIGFGIEITERKRAEEALAEERSLLRTLIDTLPNPIYVKDMESRFVVANKAAAEVLGAATADDLIGKTDFDFHPQEMAAQYIADERDVLQGQFLLQHEEVILNHQTHEPAWIITSKVPWLDRQGKIKGLMGVDTDNTERKRTHQELEASEARFRALIVNAPVGIFQAAPNGENLYVNPRWCEITGYSVSQAQGTGWGQALHPDDRNEILEKWNEVLQTGHEFSMEYRYRRPDGSAVWVYATNIALRDESGKVIEHLGTITDITERKQAEKQAMELAVEKERLRVLTDYMTSAAHDMRTPLSIISTSLFLYEQSPDPDKRAKRIRTIQAQTTRMENLIEQLALMSRIESAGEILLEHVELNRMVELLVSPLERTAQDKSVSFALDLSNEPVEVLGDVHYLGSALEQVIENAIQFTPTGGSVTVRTFRRDQEARVEVRDTGIGIPAEDIPHIFDHFYKANKARTSDESGGGLGLTIAQKIVERHNGRIEVESEPDKGSTFRLVLPLARK